MNKRIKVIFAILAISASANAAVSPYRFFKGKVVTMERGSVVLQVNKTKLRFPKDAITPKNYSVGDEVTASLTLSKGR